MPFGTVSYQPCMGIALASVTVTRMAATEQVPNFPVADGFSGGAPALQRHMTNIPPGPILAATLAALGRTNTGAALLLRPGPAPEAERLQLARALLSDAIAHGGTFLEAERGEMLLLSADTDRVTRLQPVLTQLFGARPGSAHLWHLPHDRGELVSWSRQALPSNNRGAASLAASKGVAEALAKEPLERFLRREVMITPSATLQPVGVRLRIDEAPLLALAGGDRDLAEHGRMVVAERCHEELATPGSLRRRLGGGAPPTLLVDFAISAGSIAVEARTLAFLPAERPFGLCAVLPVSAAADGDRMAMRRQSLVAGGWGVAFSGIDGDLLPLLRPEKLEADLLIFRWSPALARLEDVVRAAGPGRLLLEGCDEAEALGFAARLGIARVSGTLPDRLLAIPRMAACPHQSKCKPEPCIERAKATSPAGRAGCAEPARLYQTQASPR